MKKKKNNAVKMVRFVRDKLYQETKNLSPKELVIFYRRKAEEIQGAFEEQQKAA